MKRSLVVTVAGLGALVYLGFVLTGEAVFALLTGWVTFPARVLPRVTADRGAVAVGLAAIALFTVGIHLAGRAWAPRWRLRWALAGTAGVFLLFAAGVALVAAIHQTAWLAAGREPLLVPGLKEDGFNRNSAHKLKMIGLGLANSRDVNGAFPPGGTFSPDGAQRHSWETHILPYLPYSTRGIDMQAAWDAPANAPNFRCVIPEFIQPGLHGAELTDARGFGLSHFAANVRVLGPNRSCRPDDILDGAANTILVGEVNADFRPWGDPVNWRDPAEGVNRSPRGFGGPRGAGGANFLMADGSVRFVSEHVRAEVLRALATPAGGEEVEPGVLQVAW